MALYTSANGVKPAPISGRFLAHNQHDLVGRAFCAADLHLGRAVLTDPTVSQAALLARVNRTYATWAIKRIDERGAIENGLVPLVPAPHVVNGNGGLPVPLDMPDYELVKFVRSIGVTRVLDAAVIAEAAE